MSLKNNFEEHKFIYTCIIILFAILLILSIYVNNDGEYDYCISWIGFSNGTLHRDHMIYNCYNIATGDFYCDYQILDDGRLEIKNILNVTKNDEGGITEIIYDEPNYFECKRWLKSKR